MLAIMACVERGVARHERRFVTIDAAGWARARGVVGQSVGCPLVALGDSLVKFGVVPAVIERRLGLHACNLAVTGGQAPSDYFVLRRLLQLGARPYALLVDGETLGEDPMNIVRVWPELLGLSECAELAWTARDARSLGVMTLAYLLPTCRTRLEARAGVLSALEGQPPIAAGMRPAYERNWRRNREAVLLPPRDDPPGTDPRPAQIDRSGYRPAPWQCHPLNAEFLTRFLDLAASCQVPVFWLLPPVHPEVQTRRERYGHDSSCEAFLHSLIARYPNLTVIDGRHAGYPPAAIADNVHLSRPGAVAFSDGIATVVAEQLRRPRTGRWHALPRWRDGLADEIERDVAVEDLRQTAQAFDRAKLASRARGRDARSLRR
jgi:hypothetical protein